MWRRAGIIVLAASSCGHAAAAPVAAPASTSAPIADAVQSPVPLPRPRPPKAKPSPWTPRADWREPRSFREAAGPDFKPAGVTSEPSACRSRLEEFAVIAAMPRLIGPGACGGGDIVRLDAVKLPGDLQVQIKPAPYLQCAMAEQVALWVRDDTAPQIAATGAVLREVMTYDDFSCRGRNRKSTGKISEHGKANALDVRGLTFTDGRFAMLTDTKWAKDVRAHLRKTACARFTTVLGPGSDGYHEEHIHLDFVQRRNGYRICQWEVRDPPPPPLPPPPPKIAQSDKSESKKPEPDKPEPQVAAVQPAPTAPEAAPPVAAPARALQVADAKVPLPRARPAGLGKPRHRRKTRPGFHFPFNLLR